MPKISIAQIYELQRSIARITDALWKLDCRANKSESSLYLDATGEAMDMTDTLHHIARRENRRGIKRL